MRVRLFVLRVKGSLAVQRKLRLSRAKKGKSISKVLVVLAVVLPIVTNGDVES
jgi:hypothetical protein